MLAACVSLFMSIFQQLVLLPVVHFDLPYQLANDKLIIWNDYSLLIFLPSNNSTEITVCRAQSTSKYILQH